MVEVLKLPVQAVEAPLGVNVQQPPRRKQDRQGNHRSGCSKIATDEKDCDERASSPKARFPVTIHSEQTIRVNGGSQPPMTFDSTPQQNGSRPLHPLVGIVFTKPGCIIPVAA